MSDTDRAKLIEEAEAWLQGGAGQHTRSLIRRLVAALRSADEGWRDIESAPKDGTRIDLWIEGDAWSRRSADAFWEVFSCAWLSPDGSFPIGDDEAATHWRPLPLPPQDQPAGEKG